MAIFCRPIISYLQPDIGKKIAKFVYSSPTCVHAPVVVDPLKEFRKDV